LSLGFCMWKYGWMIVCICWRGVTTRGLSKFILISLICIGLRGTVW